MRELRHGALAGATGSEPRRGSLDFALPSTAAPARAESFRALEAGPMTEESATRGGYRDRPVPRRTFPRAPSRRIWRSGRGGEVRRQSGSVLLPEGEENTSSAHLRALTGRGQLIEILQGYSQVLRARYTGAQVLTGPCAQRTFIKDARPAVLVRGSSRSTFSMRPLSGESRPPAGAYPTGVSSAQSGAPELERIEEILRDPGRISPPTRP